MAAVMPKRKPRVFYLDEPDWQRSLDLPMQSKKKQAEWWADLADRLGFNPETVEWLRPTVFTAEPTTSYEPPPRVEIAKEEKMVCPRCLGIHLGITYRPLKFPIECGDVVLTHYAWCPVWGEPLLSSLGAEGIVRVYPCPEDDGRRAR